MRPNSLLQLIPKNAIITIYLCGGDALHIDIGNAIKEIRIKSLMSQTDFAKALAVSFSTVNRWENGKAIPGFKALKRIKEFCESNRIDFDLEKYI